MDVLAASKSMRVWKASAGAIVFCWGGGSMYLALVRFDVVCCLLRFVMASWQWPAHVRRLLFSGGRFLLVCWEGGVEGMS